MILDNAIVNKFNQLRDRMDFTYDLYLNNPNEVNRKRHSESAERFSRFCIDTLTNLVCSSEKEAEAPSSERPVGNQQRAVCNQCKSDLVYTLPNGCQFKSSGYIEGFDNWCSSCLAKHCLSTTCEDCKELNPAQKSACSFRSRAEELRNKKTSKDPQDPLELSVEEDYIKCKTCGSTLLVDIGDGRYIGSSDFMEEFPGWCLPCILEFVDTHCRTEGSCKTCSVHMDSDTCIFRDKIAGLREMLSDDFDI